MSIRLGLPALLAALCVTCAGPESGGGFRLTLELKDASTGATLPGLIRVRNERGESVPLPSLLGRGLGLEAKDASQVWSVIRGRVVLPLPLGRFTIEAIHGLETEMGRAEVDGAQGGDAEISISLRRFYNSEARGWRGANTHLHLKDLGRAEADRYLREVPAADGLDVLFVSYLERAVADRTYVSNQYSEGDLARLAKEAGVLLGNGEEHRHNFGGFDEGYGHVLFLDLRRLIRPVSIGQGIMKEGPDAPPLQQGIDEAKRQGATVIWCHNSFGTEDIPNWISGRPHAQNIFDGDPEAHGSYRDTFYRYLNSGLRVPFSTGTDWFIYDFSRAYAQVPRLESPRDWLRMLEAGRTYITNGPFLEFEVDGKSPGDVLSLDTRRSVRLAGRAFGRIDFRKIELVQNGDVKAVASSHAKGGHFEAVLDILADLDAPCWLALRIPPPPTREEPNESAPRSELGGPLFAHTSPIYVSFAGKGVFQPEVAAGLLEEMKQAREKIAMKGVFSDEHQKGHVLEVYSAAIAALEKKLRP